MGLHQQGIVLLIIMQLLGHEDASSTAAFYGFVTVHMMRSAINVTTLAIRSARREPTWR